MHLSRLIRDRKNLIKDNEKINAEIEILLEKLKEKPHLKHSSDRVHVLRREIKSNNDLLKFIDEKIEDFNSREVTSD